MIDYFSVNDDYSHLSIHDLLDARDQYHVHLMHKRNVLATAIGKYRIRKEDPYPDKTQTLTEPKTKNDGPRTLANSEVRYYSWPCVLVFVEKWEDESTIARGDYGSLVPKTLFLPNGRKIPVCVVQADKNDENVPSNAEAKFPDNMIGGGYPVLIDVQGKRHIASMGCLLTDGHTTYALTNHHVAGNAGETLFTLTDSKYTPIGKSCHKQLSRIKFEKLYPNFKGKNTYVHLDVGLIEITDLNNWTAQVYGIGELGKMADLSSETLSLGLIGCPVKAFGCSSGLMHGQIDALFYRYKSIGGSEYVSDFMIGKRPGPWDKKNNDDLFTRPGDSGTVWVIDVDSADKAYINQPIAIQWGGHVFNGDGSKSAYALATGFSMVCDLLDVDLVRDWNTGQDEYWGSVGHYTIANAAIALLKNKALRKLMQDNLDNITFETADIEIKKLKGLSKRNFVPMADVPDMVWKIRGGENQRPSENPNHFADMDKPDSDNKTLLDLMQKAGDVTANAWMDYYADPKVKDSTKGCLPFRVWQIFDLMVSYATDGKLPEFVAAAGILAHYVGDACQPLHISYMFNGMPDTKAGYGVHSAYEDDMVNANMDNMRPEIDAAAAKLDITTDLSNGNEAAFEVITLMKNTFGTIKPLDIVNAFIKVENESKSVYAGELFKKFGADTIQIMADGSAALASLWESAWNTGKGKDKLISLAGGTPNAIDKDELVKLYQDKAFLPSLRLKDFQADPIYNLGKPASDGSTGNVKKTAKATTKTKTKTTAKPKKSNVAAQPKRRKAPTKKKTVKS